MTGVAKTSARTVGVTKSASPSSGRSLSQLIVAALAKSTEADPHVIARRLLPQLENDHVDELVLAGLLDRVSKHIQMVRGSGVTARPAGPSKWRVVQRVCPGSQWKLLEDCDLSDLVMLAEQSRDLAARNAARALEYEQLADRLRASGCATVGELWARDESLAAA